MNIITVIINSKEVLRCINIQKNIDSSNSDSDDSRGSNHMNRSRNASDPQKLQVAEFDDRMCLTTKPSDAFGSP